MIMKTHKLKMLVGRILCVVFLFGLKVNQVVGQTEDNMLKDRASSVHQLSQLGNAIMIYSDSHGGKYPDTLAAFKSYTGIDADWLIKNVCYIGAGMASNSPPDKPIAFDKTMLSKTNSTVILYNDKHVEFASYQKLAKLVIPLDMNICTAGSSDLADRSTDANLILKVVGPDGQGLSGARVYQYYSITFGMQKGTKYICDVNGEVKLSGGKLFKDDWQKKQSIELYGLFDNKLAGFLDINASDLGKKLEMKLTPAYRVHGKVKSTELKKIGIEVNDVFTQVIDRRNLAFESTKGIFEFFLPEGRFKLFVQVERTYGKFEDFNVPDPEGPAGQKELELNFDLPAHRLVYLIGKQAPELQQTKGWLNSKPLKLADLKGKVVLLDFWGTWCGPCVASIPKLIELNEKYHDKGLVIIGIHDDTKDSIQTLEKELNKLSKERWNGKEIPYAIVLDDGGITKIEGTQQKTDGVNTATYGIHSFPTMILIDKQGRIVDKFYPGENNELLEKLLAADVDNKP
jgi:thiol-disulfide isomerase/thioredoxin